MTQVEERGDGQDGGLQELLDAAEVVDAESYTTGTTIYGEPVDPPAEPKTVYGTVLSAFDLDRKPLVPAWMRSKTQRREVFGAGLSLGVYTMIYHISRSPKYAAKTAWYAPRGLVRLIEKQVKFGWVHESHGLRQEAATQNDAAAWQRLHVHARVVRKWRMPWLIIEAIAVTGGTIWAWLAVPHWEFWLAVAALTPILAKFGHPADKPIVDRVVIGHAFTRLTAEQVRPAMVALRIPQIKELGDIAFEQPGIHRADGGWLAPIILPPGVEAITVIERRGALSSALRLPFDQVWPEVGPEHHGQLHLWVSQRPVSVMPPPRWALLAPNAHTSFFNPLPVGYDERGRPVKHTLFQRNTLIGGQPGSGKSFNGRAIVLGALLDPTLELWIGAFKAAEDHVDLEAFTTRYLCGTDVTTLDEAAAMVEDVLGEIQRRQATLGKLKRAGRIAEGRTSPDLAHAGLGLHPLVVFLDEVHELFLHSKTAGEAMGRAIKQGRSCGVHIILVTQVAGRDSVPPEITRVISSRWCLSVLDHVANDQIMGTGAYRRGQTGTEFRPGRDAGWGVTSGIQDGYAGAARGYYPTGKDLAALLARIKAVRANSTFATPDMERTPARDVVRDVIRVFADIGVRRLDRDQVAARLAEVHDEYAGITGRGVAVRLEQAGVGTEQVWVDGQNQRGWKLETLQQAIAQRGLDD